MTVENLAFAALDAGGVTGFHRVALDTGRATPLGEFRERVVDVAVPVGQN